MGRRRYRKRRDDDEGDFVEILIAGFNYPLVGIAVIILLLIGAGVAYANPTAMFGMTRLLGFMALFLAALAAFFTLAGILVRWLRKLPDAARAISNRSIQSWKNASLPPMPGTPPQTYTRWSKAPAHFSAGGSPRVSAPKHPIAATSMLTEGEMAFYDPLRDIVAGKYEIHVKAGMADVLGCRDHSQFREIAAMHIDFLLCDRQTLRPLLAIELDDQSHNQNNRKPADRWKEELLAERRIPLFRQKNQTAYDVLSVTQAIEQAIARG